MKTVVKGRTVKLPDFLIVGAPKCGTTAMHHYLKQHPQIYMPESKEPHFFATDLLKKDDFYRSIHNYMKLFEDAVNERIIGEASVFYLYSKDTPSNIHKFNKNAKVIVMLRNPVDMIYSYHSQLVFNGDEHIFDLKEALDAEKERKRGNLIPGGLRFKERLFYSEIIQFSEQLERYVDLFGRRCIHVIIYDDFKNSTADVYKATLEFLGVDATFQPEFRVINPNKRIRSYGLKNFLSNPPPWTSRIAESLLPLSFRIALTKKLERANIKYGSRPPMDPELKQRLKKRLMPEIRRLSSLLERDLTHWIDEAKDSHGRR